MILWMGVSIARGTVIKGRGIWMVENYCGLKYSNDPNQASSMQFLLSSCDSVSTLFYILQLGLPILCIPAASRK